jgi:MORN repeat
MKKIILIFSLMLCALKTFGQTGCVSGNCENGSGKKVFTNTKDSFTYYEGDWKNGLYDGQGTLQIQDTIFVGVFIEGKKNGLFKVYEGKKIKDKSIVFEGEFVNDTLGNFGTYADKYLVSVWKVSGSKVIATITIKSAGIMRQARNGESNWASYKGEVLSKEYPGIREGYGILYQNIWSPGLKYGFYKNDTRSNSPEEQLAADQYTEAHKNDCLRCGADGWIYETETVGGGTYTTGGETVYGALTTTYDVNGKGTTSRNSYVNPTYIFTRGSYKKSVKVTCPVCGGTGIKK